VSGEANRASVGRQEHTKSEIPKLLSTFHILPFLYSSLDTANHHSSNTDSHHTAEVRAVYRDNLADILPIHIQSRSDSLRLNHTTLTNVTATRTNAAYIHSIILPRDISHRPNRTLNGRMEAVVILRCKSENRESTAGILSRLPLVGVAEESGNGEFAAFDPEACGLANGLECHQSTIGAAHDTIWVVGAFDWTGRGFKFAVESGVALVG